MVVHGQIILNQFRVYPNKAIAASAFATALKAAMESRRHSKLYMASAKAKRPTSGNRNPMKVRLLRSPVDWSVAVSITASFTRLL